MGACWPSDLMDLLEGTHLIVASFLWTLAPAPGIDSLEYVEVLLIESLTRFMTKKDPVAGVTRGMHIFLSLFRLYLSEWRIVSATSSFSHWVLTGPKALPAQYDCLYSWHWPSQSYAARLCLDRSEFMFDFSRSSKAGGGWKT